MHGLINRAIQTFLTDTYGRSRWEDVAKAANTGTTDFEAMLQYDPSVSRQLLTAAVEVLSKPRAVLLDDMGTYLVSNPNMESLRRLLRFGGADFVEFLFSLEDLPGRAGLAIPDLTLPGMEIEELQRNLFLLHIDSWLEGFPQVVAGIIRAIADDYGALVLLEPVRVTQTRETLQISVVEAAFAKGRSFELGAVL